MARVRFLAGTMWSMWLLTLLAVPASAGVTIGPFDSNHGDSIVYYYNVSAPEVLIGSPASPVSVEYDGDAAPLLKVFQITGSAYHHLHVTQYWVVDGDEYVYDWNEVLVVPDGSGGWMPSGNYDDLWFSAKASVTPQPTADPVPTILLLFNNPLDLMVIEWGAGLPVGTQVTVDMWITVPAGIATFGIYQFQELTVSVPEPATMGLIGLGLGMLLIRRTRRRRVR